MKKVDILYRDICKKYFPRWKPWEFTFNHKWHRSGYCNTYQKHIYFGDKSPVLIIHEICHAVGAPNHGKKWQTRVLKAAETAKKYDFELSEKLIAEVEEYRNSRITEREEMENLYNNIEDTFYEIYSENKPVNVFSVIKYFLDELGIRKEWNKEKFEKILKRGRRIASEVKKGYQ